MNTELKVLIVGGYGTFGGRLVELLEYESRLVLMVAGRSVAKAGAYCQSRHNAKAKLVPVAFDRNGDLGKQLQALCPNILVDASGPFQAYGKKPHGLAEACIAHAIHYLDLADGSDFVAGIGALDTAARASDVYVLSGASTYPVLTAAVVRRLSFDMSRVVFVESGIAPSPHAGVGENVIRAIASYAGKHVPLRRNGKSSFGHPFTEQMRFTIAPPGVMPLRSTIFSLIDAPDLCVLPDLWPEVKRVWTGAGPVPEILHRALICLAWLVRFRLVPTLVPLAPLMFFATNYLSWGEHRGGMFVRVRGEKASGAIFERSWHLIAIGDDGPLIPSMAVAAIIRKVLEGGTPPPGARAATRDVELDDYEPLFASHAIASGIREQEVSSTPLYARILGAAWDKLPGPLQVMHDLNDHTIAEGRAVVDRGSGILANAIAATIGFPRSGVDIPVTVRFKVTKSGEIWTRNFDGKSFSSHQFEGHCRSLRLLCERFGPLTFAMALVIDRNYLRLVVRRWDFLGITMPMWLCPRVNSYETAEDGWFRFYVEVSFPWVGLIVRYQGWLVPKPAVSAQPTHVGEIIVEEV